MGIVEEHPGCFGFGIASFGAPAQQRRELGRKLFQDGSIHLADECKTRAAQDDVLETYDKFVVHHPGEFTSGECTAGE